MRTLKQALLGFAVIGALGAATPAFAALTVVGTYSGNECSGQGGFPNCYATQSGVTQGPTTDPLASPSIYKLHPNNSAQVSPVFPTITGNEFNVVYTAGSNNLSFTYTPGTGDPEVHYVSVKQSNDYVLFYDPNPILSGSLDLSTWFPNNPGWSHITFFDTRTPPIPEPGTWAMLLLGFGGVGIAIRRRRKQTGKLLQIA